MAQINDNYLLLSSSYLFSEIRSRVIAFEEKSKLSPGKSPSVIKLGIGDVTQPLPQVCIEAFHKAIDEMSAPSTFRGYGPEQGYEFLREAIAKVDFHDRGINHISANDIFVSDGSKCDCGNIQEIFSAQSRIAITDPVYPVYVDSNVMAGRSGPCTQGRYEGLIYLECTAETGFTPQLPSEPVDIVYLCSPNNPTGAVLTRAELTNWVNFAKNSGALIIFDAAYEAFIRDPQIPRSIFEIPGAEEVAIELRSLSKTAGFTGTRCAFTIIPPQCTALDKKGNKIAVRDLWFRRQSTKFNGVSYLVQRAAEAVYTPAGQQEVQRLSDYYLENARILQDSLEGSSEKVYGGTNAPYIWTACGQDSWSYFDQLLQNYGLVCTPGAGFGRCGEGYVRFSAFNQREAIEEAAQRLKKG